jgi:hypothetical protein
MVHLNATKTAHSMSAPPPARPAEVDEVQIEITQGTVDAAPEIADIHLSARREAMPYLNSSYTEDETRDWFARVVGDPPASWWVARREGRIVAYLTIYGEHLDHLYVRPGTQRRRVGPGFSAQRQREGILRSAGVPNRRIHGRR